MYYGGNEETGPLFFCEALYRDVMGKLGCYALILAAKELDPNLPRGFHPGASMLGEIDSTDIPF